MATLRSPVLFSTLCTLFEIEKPFQAFHIESTRTLSMAKVCIHDVPVR